METDMATDIEIKKTDRKIIRDIEKGTTIPLWVPEVTYWETDKVTD